MNIYLITPLDSRGRTHSTYVVEKEIFYWVTSDNPGLPSAIHRGRRGYEDQTTPAVILRELEKVKAKNPAQKTVVIIEDEFP